MNKQEQQRLLNEMLDRAKANGENMTIAQAIKKLHRMYITSQLWAKGLRASGFLVVAGLVEDEPDADGLAVANRKLLNIFNRYLEMENQLTGASGVLLLEAMDKVGIDYRNSPTYPVGLPIATVA
jgi:hypothetical protein